VVDDKGFDLFLACWSIIFFTLAKLSLKCDLRMLPVVSSNV
jgi:hypothetical protein